MVPQMAVAVVVSIVLLTEAKGAVAEAGAAVAAEEEVGAEVEGVGVAVVAEAGVDKVKGREVARGAFLECGRSHVHQNADINSVLLSLCLPHHKHCRLIDQHKQMC